MPMTPTTPIFEDELIAFAANLDTPQWLAQAAQALSNRDPVKAANEAECFAEMLRKRADRVLVESQGFAPK